MSRSIPSQRFFTADKRAPKSEQSSSLQLVDVGGNGDCGFRAVTAGLLDYVRFNSRVNDNVLKKLLRYYFRYYPQHQPEQAYLTAKERVEILMRNVPLPELINTMAYALRQMAVDTMVAHPGMYRGAFVHEHEETSPSDMRKPLTWIDENALAALANEMDMTISVSVVGQQRELPLRLEYNRTENPSVGKPEIAIQLNKEHYMPKVHHPELFNPITQRQARQMNPANVAIADPDMDTILKNIKQHDQQMLDSYHATKKSIQSAVDAGELSKDELMGLYISGMSHSDYLQGRVKQIGLEHGTQDFFQTLETYQNASSAEKQPADHNDRIVKELIHALARAVSIGQISEDKLFISVEEHRNAFK